MAAAPILVAGGGIGGLAVALGLALKGRATVVLEKAPELGEIGAGIQLGPNAFHCFDALGVGDQARRMAVFIDKLSLMDAISGEEITHIPLDEPFRARFGNPYAVVHRGDLHGVLLDACRANPLVDLRAGCAGRRGREATWLRGPRCPSRGRPSPRTGPLGRTPTTA